MGRSMAIERQLQTTITHDSECQIRKEWADWKDIEEENILENKFR